MKKLSTRILILCLSVATLQAQPEWQFFHASDGVSDYKIQGNDLWVSSSSGLHKIDLTTQARTTFNSENSDIPGHLFDGIAVDAAGEVWMAGSYYNQQLTKFDGSDWQIWTTINGDTIQGIKSIIPTPTGKVWLYGYLDSIVLMTYENGSFLSTPKPDPAWQFIGATQSQIAVTSNGHVWIMLRDQNWENFRLGEFDGTNWILHDLSSYYSFLTYTPHLYSDNDNNLYYLDGDLSGSRIMKYDGQNWTAIDAPFDINTYNNSKNPMYMDAQNQLWVGLWDNRLAKFDGINWTMDDLTSMGLTGGHPDNFSMDANGDWWFIYWREFPYSFVQSLYKFDGTDFSEIDLSNSALPTNFLESMEIDSFQNKWIKSYSGLLKFDGNQWQKPSFPPYSEYLYPSATDKWGNLWFGYSGSDFIGRYDGLAFTKIDVVSPSGLPYNGIGNLVIGNDGTVYLATGGAEVFIFKNGEVSYLDSMMFDDFGFPTEDASEFVAIDKSGKLWSLGFYALHRLDGNSWTEIPLFTSSSPIYTDGLQVDPQNNILILYGNGYYLYDGQDWSSFSYPFPAYTYPAWDSESNLWVGGSDGIHKFDGTIWTDYNIYNSPLPASFINDLKIDQNDNIWIIMDNAGLAVFNENGIQDITAQQMPQLSGTIYRDLNNDQQLDPSDLPLAFQKTLLLPDSIITFSSYEGSYQYRLPEGDYEVKYLPSANWHLDPSSPTNHTVSLGANGQDEQDFRVSPDMEIRDIDVNYIGGFPRCNFQTSAWLNFKNIGTLAESGVVSLELDPKVSLIMSYPAPDATSGNLLTWDFTNLLPTESRQVYLYLQMPDESNTDSLLYFEATAARQDAQAGLVNVDTSSLEQVVSCAFDPNDKLAKPTGEVQEGQSLQADALEYTIRFQNTGNDTAFTVVIRDTLDAQFDPNTLEILGSSHPMSTRLQPNGALEFRFANILLPDSTTNEAASHGFVSYRVKAKNGLPASATVANTAYIYFDLNQPVVTNTTVNELVDDFVAVFEKNKAKQQLIINPNPASSWTNIGLATPVAEDFHLKIFNSKGSLVLSQQINGMKPTPINMTAFSSGMYWVVLENEGIYGIGKLIKQ